MSADASFDIGRSHRICEDYAVAGPGPNGSFAVVSDGCSSSPDTDFGARLLAAAAASDLRGGTLDPKRALATAAEAASVVGLDEHALDATLMCAHQRGNSIAVAVTGDGVVAAVTHTGIIEAWVIRHPTGAPAYLSYHLNPRRLVAYLSEHDRREIEELFAGHRFRVEAAPVTDDYVWRLSLPAWRYRVVALVSDGASSFVSDAGPVPVGDVLSHLLDFKVYKGAFVQRRLRKFLRLECRQRNWHHEDDVALAAIHPTAPHEGAA
jgi:hypothetical protein